MGSSSTRKSSWRLDLGKAAEESGAWDVLWLNDGTGLWESIGGYVEDGALKAELKHFSEYGGSEDSDTARD